MKKLFKVSAINTKGVIVYTGTLQACTEYQAIDFIKMFSGPVGKVCWTADVIRNLKELN